jgi:hypothetical protein
MDFVLLAIPAGLAFVDILCLYKTPQICLELPPVVGGVAMSREKRCLEATHRMRGRKQVVSQLGRFNDNLIRSRKFHGIVFSFLG